MNMQRFQGKRVAIYARYSSNMQRETSIEDQLRCCTEFIERAGGKVNDELVFADYAVSGSSLERAKVELLIDRVEKGDIDAVVVDEVSRLSRDSADGMALYRKLTYLEVPIIGVGDGVNTGERHGKITYGVKLLMGDVAIDEIRHRTKRGLDGRAIAGYSTGGLPYGYRSISDVDEHGRERGHLIEIYPEQALVIRRIFELYRAGHSCNAIAGALNDESVPPPRAHTLHRRKGWVKTTIRAMLRNEAYLGRWSFNKREWRKLPGKNQRRYRERPEDQIIRNDWPERRIVDQETWSEVKIRIASVAAHYKPKGGSKGHHGKRTNYALSGLLACECGASMVITGGTSANYYKCGDAKNRHTCKNNVGLREDTARAGIFGELERRFTSPEAIIYLRKAIAAHLKELGKTSTAELRSHRATLERTEQRIGALIQFIAGGNKSPYVQTALRDLESQASTEKAAIAALLASSERPIVLPSPDEVLRRGLRLRELLHGDPLAAQLALRRLFNGQRLVLHPQPDRSYVVEGQYFPLLAISDVMAHKSPTPRNGSEARYSDGCAGRI